MRLFCWGLVLVALAGAGCLDSNLLRLGRQPPEAKKEDPPAAVAAPPPPPVTAEQVTVHNAQAKADALWEELDRDESGCAAGSAACDCQACAGRHN